MEKVKLNIVPKGKKSTCYASQNDNGRVVRFELFNELIPYILDGSETISIKVVRPDSEEILASIENTFEGEAYIDVVFNANMTEIAGVGECEITITDGETVLGSRNFDMNIEIDAYNGKDVVIETATGVIASFNTEVEDNALEYESEIPYNAEGYTGLEIINSRTAPAYDKTPYLFRKTPSGYGNSCIEKLNGLSVAFNQLSNTLTASGVSNDVTYTNNNDGSFTVVGTADGIAYRQVTVNYHAGENHVVLYWYGVLSVENQYRIGDFNNGQTIRYNAPYAIVKKGTANAVSIGVQVYDTKSINITFKPMIIDLTQMFGSTIADYIYSLETAQAGAGVSFFKSLFGADYYAYNAGELMSVKTSGRKTIGFNQWPETWEAGYIALEDGQKNAANNRIISKDMIRVLPNTDYYIRVPYSDTYVVDVFYYDKSGNYLGYKLNRNSREFTTPDNCYSILFGCWTVYGGTYNHDICVNFSDPARNGQYEPYNAVTYPLDPDLELRGIPKLDANNKLYGDGDIYESNGDVTRRYGIVDLGSLSWGYNSANAFFYASVSGIKYKASNLLAVGYITTSAKLPAEMASVENMTICTRNYDGEQIQIKNTAYTDAPTFTTAINGVYLVYELATPTSESADPYTDLQEARVTEEFIDDRSIPIPVAQDSIYGTDIEYQDIDFDTTIYGGNINAVDGVLSSEYNSDGSVKPTPEIIDITPTLIPVRAGDNKIFNSANGNQTIRYYNQVEE